MNETFRPKSNFAWAGVSFLLITLFVANSVLVVDNWVQNIAELTFALLLAGLAHAIWIRPKLIFKEDSLEVINPWNSAVIAYRDILDLETKWALTIVHNGGRTRVWVAPASGKRRWIANETFGWYGRGVPLSQSRGIETGSMSESLDSLSGQAAYMIRERMKRLH